MILLLLSVVVFDVAYVFLNDSSNCMLKNYLKKDVEKETFSFMKTRL
jgi:hypothetical protein